MPKRSSTVGNQNREIPPDDAKESARSTVIKHEKNPAAVALGRLGGIKGGTARAKSLTKEQRSEIARKAAEARWKKIDEA